MKVRKKAAQTRPQRFRAVSNRYSHHLVALKQNRGTGTALGSNSGALPCLFHWETQEYGPGAVALPLAVSNRYSHHLAVLKQNRGTGTAPGPNSGALL